MLSYLLIFFRINLYSRKVNLSLCRGNFFLLLGKNGAGKTTLLKKLIWNNFNTFFKYNNVYFYNQDIFLNKNIKKIYLLQNFILFSFAYYYSYLNLKNYDKKLYFLSFGQKCKFVLTKLIVIPNQIWFLDEPFLGLDKKSIVYLFNLMVLHLKKYGVLFLVSHLSLFKKYFSLEINL